MNTADKAECNAADSRSGTERETAPEMGSDIQAGTQAAIDLGQRLKQARSARKLSERDLARKINLTGSTITRIETGQWDELGAPVYLRGYVDGLAKVLGVDCQSAETYFRSRERQAAEASRSEFLVTPRPSAFHHSHRLLATVAATALLAIPAVWLVMGAFEGDIRPPNAPARETLAEAGLEQGGDAATETASQRIEPRLATMTTLPELRRDRPISPPEPLPKAPVLHLDFSEEAWLEVHDGSGRRLAYGLMAPDTRRSFESVEGLTVRLGNADAVTAYLDDAIFELSDHSTAELAEFTLPAR